MRIDFVITELFVGGAERCLTEVATGLADSGDDVRVFSLGSLPTGEKASLVERLEASGISVESGNADSLSRSLSAYLQLQKWLRDSPPELCQTFLYHANVLGTRAAKSCGVPWRVSGIRVAESNALRCKLEGFVLRDCHSTLCVSQAVRAFALSKLNCPEESLTVIPNGVDVSRFSTTNPFDWTTVGWPSDAAVTLFVGRLHPQKGIEHLQSQIDRIARSGSSHRLMIVGDGPLRNELQSWADQVGSDRVQLLGWQQSIPELMAASRLLVLPSHYEGMANVVLEAMAAGKPVVASRVEGSEELLQRYTEAQGFAPGDDAVMANLIQRFLVDQSHAEKVGEANQEFVRSRFSSAAMVDAYRSHYRSLCSRRLEVD